MSMLQQAIRADDAIFLILLLAIKQTEGAQKINRYIEFDKHRLLEFQS